MDLCVSCGKDGPFTKSMKRRLAAGQRKCAACSCLPSQSSASSTPCVASSSPSSPPSSSSPSSSSPSSSSPSSSPSSSSCSDAASTSAIKPKGEKTHSTASKKKEVPSKPQFEDTKTSNITGNDNNDNPDGVVKSPSDKREYRALKLSNGMEVLLIASPLSDVMGAVALSVRVGYFSDPPEVPGLAHFCEHMLFLGTKEYPDENEWEHFLATNGGDSNASTDCEVTVFQFEIALAHLGPALQRFSSFFTCPLFKASGVKREIRAVDSEFKDDLQSDSHRSGEVLMETTTPSHPYHKFGWGNLATLETLPKENKIDVRAELLKFHKRHYSAHAMKLVVHGQNLDQMASDVTRFFSPIKSTETKLNDFGSFGDPFPPSALMHAYNIVSTKESRLSLTLSWSLPCLFKYYQSGPMEYINTLIGHEGVGSLLSLLKVKGWAVGLEAGASEGDGECMNTAFWLQTVNITLSALGFEHRMEVAGAVFQYLRMLRSTGVQKWYWDEIKAINEAHFRYLEQEDPLDYVENLARCLHHYPIQHCISGPVLFTKFDPSIITTVLDLLTPERVRLDVLSSSFRPQSDTTTTWFRTPYFKEPIPRDLIESWKNGPVDSSLAFPAVNPFVPLDFSIKTEEAKRKSKSPKHEPGAHIPTQVLKDRFGTVWHLLDTQFSLPKAQVLVSLQSPLLYSSAHNNACGVLVCDVLNDWLTHHTYPASMAGLNFSAHHGRAGLEISFRGFNHKLLNLVETVFAHIALLSSVLTTDEYIQQRFATNKELASKEYNTSMYEPSSQARYGRAMVVCEKKILVEDTAQALSGVSIAQVQTYLQEFLKQLEVVMFVHGNITKAEALSIWEMLRKKLNWLVLPKKIQERGLELKHGENSYLILQTRNPKESNSAVEVYYQIGEGTMETRCYLLLLNHLMWEPCFDQLRTKEQLGYQVSSGIRTTISNIYGFIIAIQSEAYSPNFLDWRIERFVKKFRRRLDKMSKPQYKKSVLGLLTEMARPDNNLGEVTNRVWNEISEHTFNFRRIEQQIECVRTIKQADMLRFYDQYILGRSGDVFNTQRAKLASCVFGFGYLPVNGAPASASTASSTQPHPHVHCSSLQNHGHRTMWTADLALHHESIDDVAIARFQERRDLEEDEGDEGEEGDEEDEGDSDEEDESEEKFDMAELQDVTAVRIVRTHAELLTYKSKLRVYPHVLQQKLDVLM